MSIINPIQNKLKYIFSTHIIQNLNNIFNIFSDLPKNYTDYMTHSVLKFLACRDLKKGYLKVKCLSCKLIHTIPLSCKSKLCPTCGYKYSQVWTQNIQKDILNINHRHVLFTIPHECREFFFYDRTLLSKMGSAVNEVFKYQFHNISKKNKRVNNISKYSHKYFTNSDIIHYGLITVIHTFGRDLKWNPHVHAIVSLGGFNKNFIFKKLDYFNVNTIAGQWKYHVLNIIANGNYPNDRIKIKAKTIVNKLYAENTRLFFNIADGDVNDNKGIIKYLGRYLARSPIAEYKITEITDKEVTFFFNDLKNNKEKTYRTMEINKFIQQVLIHLPPKNFKSVNRFGFYARRISNKLKEAIKIYKKKIEQPKLSFYQKQMLDTFGINPFVCPTCDTRMSVCEFYHYLDPYGIRYY